MADYHDSGHPERGRRAEEVTDDFVECPPELKCCMFRSKGLWCWPFWYVSLSTSDDRAEMEATIGLRLSLAYTQGNEEAQGDCIGSRPHSVL
jgi:hypothetical protein